MSLHNHKDKGSCAKHHIWLEKTPRLRDEEEIGVKEATNKLQRTSPPPPTPSGGLIYRKVWDQDFTEETHGK